MVNQELNDLLTRWNKATSQLPWGVQKQFLETLKAAEAEQIHLVHSADYKGNYPCLVNANAATLASLQGVGGTGKPGQHFGEIVNVFDNINRIVDRETGNTKDNFVSHITANLLVRHFGDIKTVEQASAEAHAIDTLPVTESPYIEKTDDELMQDWIAGLNAPPTEEGNDGEVRSEAEASAEHLDADHPA